MKTLTSSRVTSGSVTQRTAPFKSALTKSKKMMIMMRMECVQKKESFTQITHLTVVRSMPKKRVVIGNVMIARASNLVVRSTAWTRLEEMTTFIVVITASTGITPHFLSARRSALTESKPSYAMTSPNFVVSTSVVERIVKLRSLIFSVI